MLPEGMTEGHCRCRKSCCRMLTSGAPCPPKANTKFRDDASFRVLLNSPFGCLSVPSRPLLESQHPYNSGVQQNNHKNIQSCPSLFSAQETLQAKQHNSSFLKVICCNLLQAGVLRSVALSLDVLCRHCGTCHAVHTTDQWN